MKVAVRRNYCDALKVAQARDYQRNRDGRNKGYKVKPMARHETPRPPIMFKITDTTGTVNETIPFELAISVGVWADMLSSEHSKNTDEAVLSKIKSHTKQ